MNGPVDVRAEFDRLYAEWERQIQDPKIRLSSRPSDYTELAPYRKIVALGKEALSLVLKKVKDGVFLMNQAALEIAGVDLKEIIDREQRLPAKERASFAAEETPQFLGEKQKSELILKHLK